MSDVKLNKNQRKFFEEALIHFGDRSTDVLRKELVEFSNEHDLIMPTSVLKKYCKGDIRGHYDLTRVGITPTKPIEEEKEEAPTMGEFRSSPDVILDTPAFAGDTETVIGVTKSIKNKENIGGKYPGAPYKTKKPLYVLITSEYETFSIHETIAGAYNNKMSLLHSGCDVTLDEAIETVMKKGHVVINSTNSALWCAIITMELKT